MKNIKEANYTDGVRISFNNEELHIFKDDKITVITDDTDFPQKVMGVVEMAYQDAIIVNDMEIPYEYILEIMKE